MTNLFESLAPWTGLVCTLLMLLVPTFAHAEEGGLRETIDREIKARWAKEKLAPPKPSTDLVFLRRVHLDLVGMIPTYEETTAFLGDTDSKKRELLIDKLLADPRYPLNQAQVWDVNLLGRNPKGIRATNRDAFRKWLATQPVEQLIRIGRLQHRLEIVLYIRDFTGEPQGQQVQVMITEDGDAGGTQRAHEAERCQRFGPPVYQVAG